MTDTGFTSEVASLPLQGRHLLVLGAAGEIGESLVAECMAMGAVVTAMSRSAERLETLRGRLVSDARLSARVDESFKPLVAALDTEADSDALRESASAASRPIDGVIASLGGWRQGAAVTATSLDGWREVLDQSLTAHFLAARALLPVLADRAGASYCFVNGGAALSPAPGAGPMCVSAAGQLMLMRALAVEHARAAVRVNALVLSTPVLSRSRPTGPASWLTAGGVGQYAARLASEEGASVRGHVIPLNSVRDLEWLPRVRA
ncbi:MAG TPA: SDR family NAD(P)-dependent oxidoreductase [Gemmatimonadaceae bacterium]|nr:SDR family NAD(P)-dependent oxidoreductase [Gemmatimonadaceae bacterium]